MEPEGIYSNSIKSFPLCKRKFTQFISEDTTFVCIWPIVLFNDRDYIAKWRLNGSDLLNKKQLYQPATKVKTQTPKFFKFSSIEENDFGEYQLWISFNQMDSNTKKYIMKNYLIAQMFLFQAEDILTYAYVTVGNALFLKYFFPFENVFRYYDHYSFKYRIESKLIGVISLGNQSQRFSNGCSVLTSIVYGNQVEPMFYYDKYVYVVVCTPSISFGRHSIIFNLTRLDKTLHSKQHVELASPMTYMVLPYKSLYISNASYDEYQSAQDIDNIDLSYEEKHLFLRNITDVFWLLILNSFLILMCMFLFGTMNKMHLLLYSALHKLVFGYNAGVTQNSNNGCLEKIVGEPLYNNVHQKDVMIISTGDDNVFIQEIKSCLEKTKTKYAFLTDLESVFLRSAFIYDEKLPRLYTNVVLNQIEDRDNLHSIRLDYDNNQRRLIDLDHRFPICKRLIYRHLGEDVKIKCKWPTEYIMIEYYESNWTLNGKDVEYSDNMKISSTQEITTVTF
ncbi:unnamed protein product [Mytilus edulis]|uniref:Uncharacterized protein n=1 Tax=Mytilus edulis TaxID=6550 RepID=A0A8S3VHT4_MYTED|nr:unnamed protein product [Mytilus edulis]